MDALMLDGNAFAGLLQEVFGDDVTAATGTCTACGAIEPVGALHAFVGAGVVLRCPHCDHVHVVIVRSETHLRVSLEGVRALTLPVRGEPAGEG